MKQSVFRGWMSFISCVITSLICCGFVYNQMSLLLEPISTSLGISRTLLSTLQSLTPIVNTTITVFFMKFHDKIGLRLMMIIGCISMILFCVLYYLAGIMTSAAVVLMALAHILAAINMSWATAMTANIVITNWFAKNIGTFISLFGSAAGIGGVIAAPLVSKWIASSGWQTTMLYFLLVSVASLIVVVLFFRTAPGKDEGKIWAGEEETAEGETLAGLTLEQAKKTKNFVFAMILCLGLGVFMYPPMMVLAPYCADCGFAELGGTAMSVLFAVQIIVTIPLGGLVEKFGLKPVVLPVMVLLLTALLAVSFISGTAVIYFAAASFGAAMAVVNVLIGLLIGAVFGNRDFAGIQGKLYVFMLAGMIVGPPIFNFVYDIAGSYKPVFVADAVAMVLMIVLLFGASKKIDFSAYEESNNIH